MRVRFTKTDVPYEKGRTYEIGETEARKLIRHGVAEPVYGPSASSAPRKKAAKKAKKSKAGG